MVLIFGGAYQGKLAYALDRFGLTDSDVFRCIIKDAAMPGNRKIIYEVDKWIMALIQEDADVAGALRRFIEHNPHAIVICNDISCGIVPTDTLQRKWRDAVGRSMAELSRCSDEVIRLFCGIPARIK